MSKHFRKSINIFIVLSLVFSIIFLMLSGNIITDAANSVAEMQEKMDAISSEEKEILQSLFAMTKEIEEQEREEKNIVIEIEAANIEIKKITQEIVNIENSYINKRDDLKQVLRSYQRNGPGSYIQIILESKNLTTFLRRLNLLRDLTHNTENILKELDISEKKFALEKVNKVEILAATEKKLLQLREVINKKLLLKEEKEKYFLTLKEEREKYQEYLTNMQQQWEELRPLFANATKEFSRILEAGNLPDDAFDLSFTINGLRATIDEKTINSMLNSYSQARLPKMLFSLHTDKLVVNIPEKNLVLEGIFSIKSDYALMFKPTTGSFYGMALKPGAIEELMLDGDLILDFKPILGNNTLKFIKLNEGSIELYITFVF